MPKFGVCTGPADAAALKSAGYDYIEGGAQPFFKGTQSDADYPGIDAYRKVDGKDPVLPIPACNSLVPGDLKIVGPEVNFDALTSYMTNCCRRAGEAGVKILVFGSGAARNVPDGFDREKAKQQIIDFLKMSAPIAQQNGVTIVCEPLNKGECNIINSVAEGMEYVEAVNHPGFECLVDSYHFWLESEPLENLERAMPHIKHVHVADMEGRTAPGETGKSDYKPFFAVLKKAGYDGLISIEGSWKPAAERMDEVLQYMKDEWASA